jgi:hypothetical protein
VQRAAQGGSAAEASTGSGVGSGVQGSRRRRPEERRGVWEWGSRRRDSGVGHGAQGSRRRRPGQRRGAQGSRRRRPGERRGGVGHREQAPMT